MAHVPYPFGPGPIGKGRAVLLTRGSNSVSRCCDEIRLIHKVMTGIERPTMSLAVKDVAPSDAQTVAHVLSEIAEIASETFELQDVFDRVASSIRRVIPFDHMGVVRILDGEWAVKHATTLGAKDCAECSGPCPLSSWSPRLRPRPGPVLRIDD